MRNQNSNTSILIGLLTLMALQLACPLSAQTSEEDSNEPFRVYFEGNSLTAGVMRALGLPTGGKGRLNSLGDRYLEFGKHIGPGMSPKQLWHKPIFSQAPYGFAKKALSEYEWDALPLQPFGETEAEEVEYCAKYIELALPKSPGIQSYLYAQWPRKSGGNYEAQWLAPAEADVRRGAVCRDRFENITRDLAEALPAEAKAPLILPVGHALYRLDQKIRAGQLPGYESIYEFYRPDGLHININGSYVGALVFYCGFFGESPVGLNVPEAEVENVTYRPFTPEQLRIVQETVWETVTGHPLAGVLSDDPVKANTILLPEATVSEPYRGLLHASFGRPPYRWTLPDGQLPEGLRLDEHGEITGTPANTGSFPLELTVVDQTGATDLQQIALTVAEDTAPEIVTESIPQLWQGEPFELSLEARNGNGGYSWDKIGRLPPGFTLEPGGRLHGAPALQGRFDLLVRVSDLDRKQPEQDVRTLTVEVGPPKSEIIMATPVKRDQVTLDGKLDEAVWNELRYKPQKAVVGQPDVSAAFDVAYVSNKGFYVAVSIQDDSLIINESEPWLGDSVEVYLDVANNREQVYNSDDFRFIFDPNGAITVIGAESRAFECAASRRPDGYDLEIFLGHGGYSHAGYYKLRDNTVFGFDLAVNDVDEDDAEPARLFWHGDERNETNPGNFGIVIFARQPSNSTFENQQ